VIKSAAHLVETEIDALWRPFPPTARYSEAAAAGELLALDNRPDFA